MRCSVTPDNSVLPILKYHACWPMAPFPMMSDIKNPVRSPFFPSSLLAFCSTRNVSAEQRAALSSLLSHSHLLASK